MSPPPVTRRATWGSRRSGARALTVPPRQRVTLPGMLRRRIQALLATRREPANLGRIAAAMDRQRVTNPVPLAAKAQFDQVFATFDAGMRMEGIDRDDPVVAASIIYAAAMANSLVASGVRPENTSTILCIYADYLRRGPL